MTESIIIIKFQIKVTSLKTHYNIVDAMYSVMDNHFLITTSSRARVRDWIKQTLRSTTQRVCLSAYVTAVS